MLWTVPIVTALIGESFAAVLSKVLAVCADAGTVQAVENRGCAGREPEGATPSGHWSEETVEGLAEPKLTEPKSRNLQPPVALRHDVAWHGRGCVYERENYRTDPAPFAQQAVKKIPRNSTFPSDTTPRPKF